MLTKNQSAVRVFSILAAVALVIGGAIALEVSLWRECRATNSFLYCLRVIAR